MSKIIQWFKRVFTFTMNPEEIQLKHIMGIGEHQPSTETKEKEERNSIFIRIRRYIEEKLIMREIKHKRCYNPNYEDPEEGFQTSFELYKENKLIAVLIWYCGGDRAIEFQNKETGEPLFAVDYFDDKAINRALLSFEAKLARTILTHDRVLFAEDLEDAKDFQEETV